LDFFIAEVSFDKRLQKLNEIVAWFFSFYSSTLNLKNIKTSKECHRLIVQGSKCNNVRELD